MKKYLFVLVLEFLTACFSFGQTKDETLDYINTKHTVYKYINEINADIFKYQIGIKKENNTEYLYIIEFIAISGKITQKNLYYVEIKKIIAIEELVDNQLKRKHINLFTSYNGVTQYNILDNEKKQISKVDLILSFNIDIEQLKKLVTAYKRLVILEGGKDLTIEKF